MNLVIKLLIDLVLIVCGFSIGVGKTNLKYIRLGSKRLDKLYKNKEYSLEYKRGSLDSLDEILSDIK